MASSVNNTAGLGLNQRLRNQDDYTDSSLSSGVTKRSLSSSTSSAVSESIARANYQSLSMSNSKIIELRKYVFKMVSTWSYEDKQNIITQYGDSALLETHATEESLNKQCTETLIINMKQQDLEILLKDIQVDERQIKKDVQSIRQKRKKTSSGQFHTSSFEDVYKKVEKSASPKDIRHYLAAYDKGFKIPKKVTNQYGQLKRELEKVLRDIYDQAEVAGLAYNLRIDIEDGTSFKEISTQIINKVLLYVSLIMGKSDTMYAGAFLRTKTYNDLLQYTSYAFVTGEAGLNNEQLRELKKNAKIAKARTKEGFTSKNRQVPLGGAASRAVSRTKDLPGTIARTIGGAVASIPMAGLGGIAGLFQGWQAGLPGATANFVKGSRRAAYRTQESILGTKRTSRKKAKEALNMINRQDALSEFDLASGNNIISSDILEQQKNLKGKDYQEILKLAETTPGIKTTGLFGKARKPKDIRNALLSTAQEAETRVMDMDIDRTNAHNAGKAYKNEAAYQAAKETASMFKDKIPKFGDKTPYVYPSNNLENNDLKVSITTKDPMVPVYVANQITNIGIKLSSPLPNDIFNEVATHALPVFVINQVNSSSDDSPITLRQKTWKKDLNGLGKGIDFELGKKDGRLRQSASEYSKKNQNILTAPNMFTFDISSPIRNIKIRNGALAVRVFDQSSMLMAEIMKEQEKTQKNEKGSSVLSESAIDMGITRIKTEPALPVYIVNAMQDVTTREDVKVSKLEQLAKTAAKAAINVAIGPVLGGPVSSVLGLATGGFGKALPKFANGTSSAASNTPVSQFIAGDSTNGKPNEEQVSINWDAKKFAVKPVPSMSKGELASGGISKALKMSSAEKSTPMKVIAVNPGIYDKVDYEGKTLSLMDVIAEMSMKISSLETLLNTGNTQRNAVIANTGATLQNIAKLGSNSKSSPFLQGGFPTGLDSILQGH